jgi:hypothetical protein
LSGSGTPISGLSGYSCNGITTYQLGNIAIDGSGNIWAVGACSSVLEFIGIATPVITPIAAGLPSTPTADGSSNLGTRP